MVYAWIITYEYMGFPEEVGTKGPYGTKMSDNEILDGAAFKMKDDDGEICYRGRIVGDYSGLEPLDDFGMPNAGCTEIWLFENKKWVQV